MLSWGWRIPFLAAFVSLLAGVILRYNMPETLEFATDHQHMDADYQRRITEREQQCHQRRRSEAAEDKQAAVSAPAAADEADDVAAVPCRRHYVPLWELFRGHWSGLLLHVAYAACE